MSGSPPASTIVLGLGNMIRSDDGVGIHALQRLEFDPRVSDDVLVLDGGTLGLDLLTYVSGARGLLVMDAVDVGAPAGRWFGSTRKNWNLCPAAEASTYSDLPTCWPLCASPHNRSRK
jgi:hydrogenase maturation protease